MHRLLLILMLLPSCTNPPQSPWSCISGIKVSKYKALSGETENFEVNYDENSARVYGKVANLHEDTFRYSDLGFSVDSSHVSFGNILIDAKIFEMKNWAQGSNRCVKTQQYSQGANEIAVVECSDNREVGSLAFTFDSEVGVTRIQQFSRGSVVDWHLLGKEGLGKMCQV